MLSHADLANLASRVYAGPWSAQIALDLREDYLPRTGELVVAVRGTDPTNALNWIRDVSIFPPMWTPGIGFLHEGFASGAVGCWKDAAPKIRKDAMISYTGHSLGGAIALILAGLHAIHRPDQPFRVITIGAPRACFGLSSRLYWLLRRAKEGAAYARRGDAVPQVPLPPIYRHPIAPTMIGVSTGDVLSNHSASRYVDDLAALKL